MSTDESARRDELRSILREIAARKLKLDRPLTAGDHLVRDLGLDSMQKLTLLIEIEDRFHVCFEETDEGAIETVDDLVEILLRRSSWRSSPNPLEKRETG